MQVKRWMRMTAIAIGTAVGLVVTGTMIGHAVMARANPLPASSEFGFGPRPSASGQYIVRVDDTEPFRTGALLTTRIRVTGPDGEPVDEALITVDGGMPQHGHGLPTRSRVTRGLGAGEYEVGGLKFNMGGWWELKIRFGGAQPDSVTFNLSL